jgi:hypothetical protein
MAKTVAKKEEYVTVYSPLGILSYPYLTKPDTGRKESSNKYSAEIYVAKSTWVKEGKQMVDDVLKVARKFFNNPKLKLSEFKGPFTDMDNATDSKGKKIEPEEWQKGTIRIRAKAGAEYKPTVIGPRKDPETDKFPVLTDEQVSNIKGGDYVRLIGTVYGYSQQGGGIAIGLNFVQFGKEGKALGQGKMAQIKDLGEIEVEVDAPEEMVDTEETLSEAADKVLASPAAAKKGKKASATAPAPVVEEDESEDEDPMMSFG